MPITRFDPIFASNTDGPIVMAVISRGGVRVVIQPPTLNVIELLRRSVNGGGRCGEGRSRGRVWGDGEEHGGEEDAVELVVVAVLMTGVALVVVIMVVFS